MTHTIKGRVVIITGAARSLGREMALELAQLGANVVITASSNSREFIQTCQELGDQGLGVVADVSDPSAADVVVQKCLDRLGSIDVLMNNAGRDMRLISEKFNTVPTKFSEISPLIWRQIIDINLNGAFCMARAVTPLMIAQGFGKIINISTSVQTMVRKGYAPYGQSKAGVEASSRVWAQDLQGAGVDVNVYLPRGAADTDLLPPIANKKGADGKLLPANIMRSAIGGLVFDATNGVKGKRFIAANWNTD